MPTAELALVLPATTLLAEAAAAVWSTFWDLRVR